MADNTRRSRSSSSNNSERQSRAEVQETQELRPSSSPRREFTPTPEAQGQQPNISADRVRQLALLGNTEIYGLSRPESPPSGNQQSRSESLDSERQWKELQDEIQSKLTLRSNDIRSWQRMQRRLLQDEGLDIPLETMNGQQSEQYKTIMDLDIDECEEKFNQMRKEQKQLLKDAGLDVKLEEMNYEQKKLCRDIISKNVYERRVLLVSIDQEKIQLFRYAGLSRVSYESMNENQKKKYEHIFNADVYSRQKLQLQLLLKDAGLKIPLKNPTDEQRQLYDDIKSKDLSQRRIMLDNIQREQDQLLQYTGLNIPFIHMEEDQKREYDKIMTENATARQSRMLQLLLKDVGLDIPLENMADEQRQLHDDIKSKDVFENSMLEKINQERLLLFEDAGLDIPFEFMNRDQIRKYGHIISLNSPERKDKFNNQKDEQDQLLQYSNLSSLSLESMNSNQKERYNEIMNLKADNRKKEIKKAKNMQRLRAAAEALNIEVPDQTSPEWAFFASKGFEYIAKRESFSENERIILGDILQGGLGDRIDETVRDTPEYKIIMRKALGYWTDIQEKKRLNMQRLQIAAKQLDIEVPDQESEEWLKFSDKALKDISGNENLGKNDRIILKDILQGGFKDKVDRNVRDSDEYKEKMLLVLSDWKKYIREKALS